MARMFKNANAFNQSIGSWNVSKVEDMEEIFGSRKFWNWDTSSCTNMLIAFLNCEEFNQPIGGWKNTTKVTNMTIIMDDVRSSRYIRLWCKPIN